MRLRRGVAVAAATAMCVSASSCSSNASRGTSTRTISVFAAASLTEAFTALGAMFQSAHPGTRVTFDFGASSALALQINEGAPADVFASASPKNLQQVLDAGGAKTSTNFVKNVMEIAVPPTNPGRISRLADLARHGVKVALCEPQVPCGTTAAKVFASAGLSIKPVTLEADVKSTLSKVELGEVDAGVVYASDVRSAGAKVMGIEIPASLNASTEYPIAVLAKSANKSTAQEFVDFVLGDQARSVLIAAGFRAP